jgi:hypothetical protein
LIVVPRHVWDRLLSAMYLTAAPESAESPREVRKRPSTRNNEWREPPIITERLSSRSPVDPALPPPASITAGADSAQHSAVGRWHAEERLKRLAEFVLP